MCWTEKLLTWYHKHKRPLPWRQTKDPYTVWLAEVIFQQTTIAQGMPYFKTFLQAYPNLKSLAAASEVEVLQRWQGLGYYARARNLLTTAKTLTEKFNAHFPKNFQQLLSLKGVGDYTASAIASICFDLPQAVVDGNVFRVLARHFALKTPINSSNAVKVFKAKATSLMATYPAGDFNQAIMEFGALICTPKKPQCHHCIFSDSCKAKKYNQVQLFPLKKQKPKVKQRFFNYLVFIDPQNKTLMQQRIKDDIWKKLYEFPLIETAVPIKEQKELFARQIMPQRYLQAIKTIAKWQKSAICQRLTHQQLFLTFWLIKTKEEMPDALSVNTIKQLPKPVALQKFVSAYFG